MAVRTGIAGWVFAPWRGAFYPAGLPQKGELAYASAHLGAIEINATFRGLQKPASFERWAAESHPDVVFPVKGPQAVTHYRRLKDCGEALDAFWASGPLALGNKLGPIVWQLPPNLSFERPMLEAFLALLPRDGAACAERAEQAPTRDGLAPYLEVNGVGTMRYAIETRHPSWLDGEAAKVFADHNVAQVIADTPEQPNRTLTANFAYCRLQGPARGAAGGYAQADINDWAKTIHGWDTAKHDVFALFVHEDKLHAPNNAMALGAALNALQ